MEITELVNVAVCVGAGISIGLGALGGGVGSGMIAAEALAGTARQPKERDALLQMMLIAQALSQTSGIFALVIAILLLFGGLQAGDLAGVLRISGAALGAGVSMGLGALGPALGGGFAGAGACAGLARNPLTLPRIRATMLMGAAVAQSTAIYAFTISIVLLMLD